MVLRKEVSDVGYFGKITMAHEVSGIRGPGDQLGSYCKGPVRRGEAMAAGVKRKELILK